MPLSREIVIDNDIVLAQKVCTNGGLVLSREFSRREPIHERSLSDTGVSQNDNLERLFVAVVGSSTVGRGVAIGWRGTVVWICVVVVGYRVLIVRRIGSLVVRIRSGIVGIVAAIRVGGVGVCIVAVVRVGNIGVSIIVVVCVGIWVVCIVAVCIVVVVIVRHGDFLFRLAMNCLVPPLISSLEN